MSKQHFDFSSFVKFRWLNEPSSNAMHDRTIVWLFLALICVGLVMVTSASSNLKSMTFSFGLKQSAFLVIALTTAMLTMLISLETWRKNSWLILATSIFLLIIVLFLGTSVNGAVRWIRVAGINIQPAEIAKFGFLIFIADYLSRRQQEVKESISGFLKPMGLFAIFACLLLLQPDLGSSVVIFFITIGMIFIAGAKLWQFFALFGVAVVAITGLIIFEPYRIRRVTSFLDPWQDPFGSGYQLIQSLIAFGRGDWFGQGLGNSVQKLEYLPEPHTDFIVSVLAEEFGFVGVVIILFLLFTLVFRAFVISKRCLEKEMLFGGFSALGIGIWLAFQTLVNVAAAAGMIPTKGLTLPLISYGGSSLIIMSATIAFLLRIDYEYRLETTQAHQRVRSYEKRTSE